MRNDAMVCTLAVLSVASWIIKPPIDSVLCLHVPGRFRVHEIVSLSSTANDEAENRLTPKSESSGGPGMSIIVKTSLELLRSRCECVKLARSSGISFLHRVRYVPAGPKTYSARDHAEYLTVTVNTQEYFALFYRFVGQWSLQTKRIQGRRGGSWPRPGRRVKPHVIISSLIHVSMGDGLEDASRKAWVNRDKAGTSECMGGWVSYGRELLHIPSWIRVVSTILWCGPSNNYENVFFLLANYHQRM